ncbi:MAG: hypothetical protein Q9210_005677 [Variospora velana]
MQYHLLPDGVDLHDPEFQRAMRKQLVKDKEPVDPKHEENSRRLNIKVIRPSENLNYLVKANPIYCGVVSFGMPTDYAEAAGISLCNWHKSIWPTAHLYNALQQTSSISKSWHEMDKLIDLHVDTLFAGQLPLSAHEYFVRFALALGLSMSNFSRNPRTRTNNERSRFRQGAKGTKLKVNEMSTVFRQYFEKKSSLETCLEKLNTLIRDQGSKASMKEREACKRPLTNQPEVTRRLEFD